MATSSSIQTAIELIGGDAAIQESKRIAAALENTAAVVSDIGKGVSPANSGLQQIFLTIKGGTQSVNEHSKAVGVLSQAYHVLHPILGTAGASMGEFRAFAVASRLGILGLAAAVGGAALVELGRLSDAAAQIKQRLLDIAGTSFGEQVASNFKRAEESTNSASGAMAAAAEAIIRAVNASKEGSSQWQVAGSQIQNLSVVTKTWSEAIQLGKVNADDAAKAVNTIAQAIFKLKSETKPGEKQTIIDFSSGLAEFKEVETEAEKVTSAVGLTFETFTQLETISPGLGRKISEAFGFKDIDAFRASLSQAPKSIEEVIAATAKMAPETDLAFKEMNSKVQGLSSEWAKFKNTLFNIAEGISPESNPITVFLAVMSAALGAFRSDTKDAKTNVDDLGKSMDDVNSRPPPVNWGAAFGRMLDDLIEKAKELNRQLQTLGGGGGGSLNEVTGTAGIGGGATGGLFRGRGGIDNNLIRISDYEYIVRPEAVRKYGVRLLDWINSLQFPVRGFAAGGLVSPQLNIPSSVATAQSNKSVTFSWKPSGFGLAGNRGTIEALEREATLRGISATGLAPGWVR